MSVRYHNPRPDCFAPDYATCDQCGIQINPPDADTGDLDDAIAWHVAACRLNREEAAMTTAATPIPTPPSTAERVLTALVNLGSAIGLSRDGISATLPLIDALINYVYEYVRTLRIREADGQYVYCAVLRPGRDGYPGGEDGVAVSEPFPHPVTVIDFMVVTPPGTFEVKTILQDDAPMLHGVSAIIADVFAPMVVGRSCHWPETQPNAVVRVKFRNVTSDPEPRPFFGLVKVRSAFPPPPSMVAEPAA